MKRLRGLLQRYISASSLRLGGLLAAGLLSVAVSSAQQLRGAEAILLAEMTLLGGALAWWAAAAGLPTGLSAVLLPAAGFMRAMWRVGRLGPAVASVIGAAFTSLWNGLHDPLRGFENPERLWDSGRLLSAQAVAVASRLAVWLQGMVEGQPQFDPLAAAMVWSTLLWCLGAWAAWLLRRRSRPLAAMLPLLALTAYTSFYTGGSASSLLIPLAALLMMMVYSEYAVRQRRWRSEQIVVAEGLAGRLSMAALPITLALVGAAALIPSLSYDRAVRWAQRLSGQREAPESAFGDSLGLEQVPQYDSPLYPARSPGLPNRHLVGSGDELSEQIVLTVSIFNLPIEGPPPRYYWRALSYDRYTGQGWVTSSTVTWSYASGEATQSGRPTGHRRVRQKVRLADQAPELAFHAGRLLTTDDEFDVAWRTAPRDAFAATLDSRIYEAQSLVPDVTEAELRAAGGDDPEWVSERYLALPEDVPDRVVALARDLTATAPTRYDRARAIVDYLRDIPYDLAVPLPPSERDVVEWFLFDLQRGYCDYYASSMVVLARAAGLPARFVVGYYTGSPEQTEGTYRYVVSAADAHSWVEVYFPNYGWVEFDPTAGRPPIERPGSAAEAQPAAPPSLEPPPRGGLEFGGLMRRALGAAGGLLALGLAGAAVIPVYDLWSLRRRRNREAVRAVFQRLKRLASRLGLSRTASPTPYELGYSLGRLAADRAGTRRAARLRPAEREIARLIDLSVRSAYSESPVERNDVFAAWWSWWTLFPRIVLVSVWERFRSNGSTQDKELATGIGDP